MMESVTREVSALEHCRSVEIGRCSRAAGIVGLAAPCKSDMTLGFSQSRLTDPRDSLARRTSTEYLLDRPDLSCAEVSGGQIWFAALQGRRRPQNQKAKWTRARRRGSFPSGLGSTLCCKFGPPALLEIRIQQDLS